MITQLYVENGVGRAIQKAINLFSREHGVTARFQDEVHPEMQRRQNGDEWWIADVAGRGMAILTQDRTILGIEQAKQAVVTSERQAVIDSQAHIIAFGNAGYSLWDKLRCVVNHWPAIRAMLNKTGPQALVLLVTKATPIPLP